MKNISVNNFNEDEISLLNNHELKKLFLEVRSRIYKGRRNRKNTKQYEVDLCYIQREIQNRNIKLR
jgi:hypothetical protein